MYPILKYPGAKWRLASWVTSYFPPHESYLEPYFGSGAVFFSKVPSRIETINDIDGKVVNFFRVCREQPDELADALRLTPWSRDERSDSYAYTNDSLESARRFAVQCWQTFGAFPSMSRGWRHSTGAKPNGGPDNPKLWARLPQCVVDASKRMLNAQIENRPALDVIKSYNGKQVLIYADPPYVKSARTACGDAYTFEMSDDDHVELLNILMEHRGSVVLSGYDNDIYNDMLHGWYKTTTKTTAERGTKRVECLWLNLACTEQLPLQGLIEND